MLNPGWLPGTPFRTGIDTALVLAAKICQLLIDYSNVIEQFLEPERQVYVQALRQACIDFTENVNPPRP